MNWEDLYEKHLELAASNITYGIRYKSWSKVCLVSN